MAGLCPQITSDVLHKAVATDREQQRMAYKRGHSHVIADLPAQKRRRVNTQPTFLPSFRPCYRICRKTAPEQVLIDTLAKRARV
eukprot:7002833-Karenia_brevis.AAC.1